MTTSNCLSACFSRTSTEIGKFSDVSCELLVRGEEATSRLDSLMIREAKKRGNGNGDKPLPETNPCTSKYRYIVTTRTLLHDAMCCRGPKGWETTMMVVRVFFSLSFPLLRCIVLYCTFPPRQLSVKARQGDCVHTHTPIVRAMLDSLFKVGKVVLEVGSSKR